MERFGVTPGLCASDRPPFRHCEKVQGQAPLEREKAGFFEVFAFGNFNEEVVFKSIVLLGFRSVCFTCDARRGRRHNIVPWTFDRLCQMSFKRSA